MPIFRRSKKPVSTPRTRQVSRAGRTASFSYHTARVENLTMQPRRRPGAREASRPIRSPQRRALLSRLSLRPVIIGLLMLLAAYMLTMSQTPRVIITGDTHAPLLKPVAVYQQAASKALHRSILNSFKPTADGTAAMASLQAQFPELTSATLLVPVFDHTPTLYIASTTPAVVLTATDASTYIIDNTGRAVAQTTAARAASLHLIPVEDLSGTPVGLGRPILSSSTIQFITTVLEQIQLKHLTVSQFTLPPSSNELDMYLYGQAYFVRFNLNSGTALQQTGTFLAVRHYLEGKGQAPASYIDVRIDGRAYYK